MTIEELSFGGDMEDVPEGWHAAILEDIRVVDNTKDGTQFRAWDFRTLSGTQVDGSSSLKAGPKSKATAWATAILGRKPVKGEGKSQLVGQPCNIYVAPNKDGWPKVTAVGPAGTAPKDAPQAVQDAPGAPPSVEAPSAATVGDLDF
jgi:hypothetical protein